MTIKDNGFVDLQTPTGPMRTHIFRPAAEGRYPGILLYSEIFQATGPIRRTAGLLAGERSAEHRSASTGKRYQMPSNARRSKGYVLAGNTNRRYLSRNRAPLNSQSSAARHSFAFTGLLSM